MVILGLCLFLATGLNIGTSLSLILLIFLPLWYFITKDTFWSLIKKVPKVVVGLYSTLICLVLSQCIIYHNLDSFILLNLLLLCGIGYLGGLKHGNKIYYVLIPFIVIESIALIVIAYIDPHQYPNFLTGVCHTSAALILTGTLLLPYKLRWYLMILSTPAIILSGSEEGLAVLVVILLLGILTHKDWRFKIGIYSLILLALTVLMPYPIISGGIKNIYPRLNNLTTEISIDNATHGRIAQIERGLETIKTNPIIGQGWQWVYRTSNTKPIHNVPVKIASEIGILGALAWFLMWLYFTIKSKNHKLALISLMGFALLDHFFWTYLMIWPWIIYGTENSNEFE